MRQFVVVLDGGLLFEEIHEIEVVGPFGSRDEAEAVAEQFKSGTLDGTGATGRLVDAHVMPIHATTEYAPERRVRSVR